MKPATTRTARTLRRLSLPATLGLALSYLACNANPVGAVPVSYTLVPAQSNIAAAFNLTSATGPVTAAAQKPNSLTARYSGHLDTNLYYQSLAFPGGSAANAANFSSNLSPAVGGTAGSAAASYGVRITAPVGQVIPPIDTGSGTINLGTLNSFITDIALRNVSLDVKNLGTINRTATTFDASKASILVSGNADINVVAQLKAPDIVNYFIDLAALQAIAAQSTFPITVSGSFITQIINISTGFTTPLNGTELTNTATNGQISLGPSTYSMTLPVNVNVAPDLGALSALFSLKVNLTGQLFGTAPAVAIPEPSSCCLAIFGVVGLLGVARRRVKLHD